MVGIVSCILTQERSVCGFLHLSRPRKTKRILPPLPPQASNSAPIECKLSEILKLNVDSLEEIFDHLSKKDLTAVGQTCTILQQVTKKYFWKNFVIIVYGRNQNIYSNCLNDDVQLDCFSDMIRSIVIEKGDLHVFQLNQFESLKQIEFHRGKILCSESISKSKAIKSFLPKVEILKFNYCKLGTDLHDHFLRHCEKLKRLYVRDERGVKEGKYFIGTSNNWLTNVYPTLEHFELESGRKSNEVIEFLQRNPQIRTFSSTFEFLIENQDFFFKSNIKLDILSISHYNSNMDETISNKFLKQLSVLQKRGFFQQMHLYFYCFAYRYGINYSSHLLSLVNLVYRPRINFKLSSMFNLEKLFLFSTYQNEDFDTALTKLTKLNYINFNSESIDNILPFLQKMPNLQKIQINGIKLGKYFNKQNNTIDLAALNEEREKCTNARKLTFYLKENIYLATKSVFHMRFRFIDIKRHESYDKRLDFAFK